MWNTLDEDIGGCRDGSDFAIADAVVDVEERVVVRSDGEDFGSGGADD